MKTETSNPYPGLMAFGQDNAPLFFGREEEVEELMRRVYKNIFTALIGLPCVGKTSLIHAGLLPALGSAKDKLQAFVIRPGDDPFLGLAVCLEETMHNPTSEAPRLSSYHEATRLSSYLRQDTDSLARLLRARGFGPSVPCLLIIDQFEELFLFGGDRFAGTAFMDLAFAALNADVLHLLVAMRSNFLSQALSYPLLAPRLSDSTVMLGPMGAEAIRRAITGPAEVSGFAFEAGLVDRILTDLGNDPGQFPALQFLLTLLWERRTDEILRHHTYQEIGGLSGALSQYIETVIQWLHQTDQSTLRNVMLRLVTPEGTRRVVGVDEFSEKESRLLDSLLGHRVVIELEDTRGKAVELVHDAVIRSWDRLRHWLKEEREFLRWRQRITVAAHEWQAFGRDANLLLRGPLLSISSEWMRTKPDMLSAAEIAFIEASLAQKSQESRAHISFVDLLGSLGLGGIQGRVAERMQAQTQLQESLESLETEILRLQRQRSGLEEKVMAMSKEINDDRPRIFISYAREDHNAAKALYEDLKNHGFCPWMDKEDILSGEDWARAIGKAIEVSDYIIVLVSRNSYGKRGWVQREIRMALNVYEGIPPGQAFLMPVRLENCSVPESLGKYQYTDLFEADGFDRLMRSMLTFWSEHHGVAG